VQSNERLLNNAIFLTARALLGPQLANAPGIDLMDALLAPILGLLDDRAAISAPVRTNALNLVRRLVYSLRDRSLVADPVQVG
jgi:hypothetical protein